MIESGISLIEDTKPHHRAISPHFFRSWLVNKGQALKSPLESGTSAAIIKQGQSVTVANPTVDEWLGSRVFELADEPINYREDGPLSGILDVGAETNQTLVSFLGIRDLISLESDGSYAHSVIETMLNKKWGRLLVECH